MHLTLFEKLQEKLTWANAERGKMPTWSESVWVQNRDVHWGILYEFFIWWSFLLLQLYMSGKSFSSFSLFKVEPDYLE